MGIAVFGWKCATHSIVLYANRNQLRRIKRKKQGTSNGTPVFLLRTGEWLLFSDDDLRAEIMVSRSKFFLWFLSQNLIDKFRKSKCGGGESNVFVRIFLGWSKRPNCCQNRHDKGQGNWRKLNVGACCLFWFWWADGFNDVLWINFPLGLPAQTKIRTSQLNWVFSQM